MPRHFRRFESYRAALLLTATATMMLGAASAIAQATATTTPAIPASIEVTSSTTDDASNSDQVSTSTGELATTTDASATQEFLNPSTSQQDDHVVATSTATSTQDAALRCTMAYVADLYDTPSGHLDPGYTLSTSTQSGALATKIGSQAWTDCNDGEGSHYEFKISPAEYAALERPDAQMPEELATSSAKLGKSPGVVTVSSAPSTAQTETAQGTADAATGPATATTTQPAASSSATSTLDLPPGSTASTPPATTSAGGLEAATSTASTD